MLVDIHIITQLMSCVHGPSSRFKNKTLDAGMSLLQTEFKTAHQLDNVMYMKEEKL